jgi:hypothetical protein|nr:MAG TPA: hypothetical protein [Inoviridae sp.]
MAQNSFCFLRKKSLQNFPIASFFNGFIYASTPDRSRPIALMQAHRQNLVFTQVEYFLGGIEPPKK